MSKLDIEAYLEKLKVRRVRTRACGLCGTETDDGADKFCLICGAASFSAGRERDMIYKSIRTTTEGKAVVCPHCDNEELSGGSFCMICGNEVINRCADVCDPDDGRVLSRGCQTLLPGNARYCPRCGNESTFYLKGWLRDWKSENVRKAIANIHVSTVEFDEIRQDKSSSLG